MISKIFGKNHCFTLTENQYGVWKRLFPVQFLKITPSEKVMPEVVFSREIFYKNVKWKKKNDKMLLTVLIFHAFDQDEKCSTESIWKK